MAWNPIQMKQENLSVLRNVFLKQHSATKPQLAKLSGLSVVTVNSLIHELLETGEVIQKQMLPSVAQYAIALLLEVTSRIGHHAKRVKEREWANNADWCFWDYPLMELSGRTMGIIGFGRIGRKVAEIAQALGMHVLFHDAHADNDTHAEKVSLEELLRRSDVVSLHCPLTKENDSLINKATLAMMKSNAILINNARGKLINEYDLVQALQNGTIYAAALDVVREEPIRNDNPLLECDNCLITPHISWASKEARRRIMDTAVENLRCFLQGKEQNRIV